LAKRVTLPPKKEYIASAVSPTPGLVLVTANSRLHRNHQVLLANGLHAVRPAEPFAVRFCNIGTAARVLKKGTVLGFATPYDGPVFSVGTLPEEGAQDDPASPLDAVDLSAIPESLRSRVQALFWRHRSMCDGSLGAIHGTEQRIDMEPGTAPIHSQPYRTGLQRRELMTKEVNRILWLNAIKPSQSDWASPVVVVPKKNCKPRFWVDYRRLNAVTKKDTYPVQRMDDCLDSFGEARFFSMLDCTAGHWKINIRKEDREKTALVCHSGLFEWLRMPCGLTNAPARFQRALDLILSGLKWQVCLVYLDDVIAFSKTVEEHIQHLDTVLSRLREAGVALNLEKCSLFKTEVEYLGQVVSPGMLRVTNRNTEALRRAAYPTTKTQMKNFLGACNVYRRFVKH